MAKTDPKPSAEVAVQAGGAVAEYDGYAEYAGAGFENQTSDDYAIPFINILQALSPQLTDNQELRQGMILNNVTGEVVQGGVGIAFIPATTQHAFVEFKPRDSGGGFVAAHQPSDQLVVETKANSAEFGTYSLPNGNELIETFYVYGLMVTEDGASSQVVIGFNSSKIKKYKGWMTMARAIQLPLPDGRRIPAPLFAHRYRLKTEMEKNPKGTFFNWSIKFDGPDAPSARLSTKDPLFLAAVHIKELIEGGKARAAHETTTQEAGGGKADDAVPTGGKPVF